MLETNSCLDFGDISLTSFPKILFRIKKKPFCKFEYHFLFFVMFFSPNDRETFIMSYLHMWQIVDFLINR